jgi:hypothetical protein
MLKSYEIGILRSYETVRRWKYQDGRIAKELVLRR